MVFTSGSTGQPKPTPILQCSFANFLTWFKERSVNHQSLTWIQFSGLSFDLFVAELLNQFVCGGSVLLIKTSKKLDLDYIIQQMWVH